ncbi:1,2-phenylacetyl-CoA epoxidase subunit PaaE [Enteractinococcus coprophilus]|uniref:Ring-1,2-phenylacetyl-CoA epoxidase subunit PaaE n=1 Tax=Enteractinococcus coprophilus TaxID=1027633 RepID=A0A543AN93_9MICC|nr:1,2-phenylacetyl-CoA epoxidase subunit PaaE [Enteractinococcus coprophilus]TQL74029.1 ring-1,2-phenylacetyl-CoA epoxidase subunit PaaE [Enteractinococcus coprophilus]
MTETLKAPARRRARFNSLTVSEIRQLTDDAIEVAFAIPEELQDDYNYVPGQYVALRATIDGEEVRRSYSICAEPVPGEIRVAIKRDFGGLFSTWAHETLKAGDTINVMNPQGAFTSRMHSTALNDPEAIVEAHENDGGHFVAIAAGSGITPIMSIVATVLKSTDNTTIDLIYANRSAMDVMFAEELGDLKDKYPARLSIHHVLSREQRISPLMSGRIDEEKLDELLTNIIPVENAVEWFLCGPFELVQMTRDKLKERGVDEDAVRYELFTTGDPSDGPRGQRGRPVEVDPRGKNRTIEFSLDGLSSSVETPVSANESVLNAALRVRPDTPFACAGGVCGTCRAKVVTGTFEMDENYALESDEVEAGYVLTCQTRPTSDSLTVDFDA